MQGPPPGYSPHPSSPHEKNMYASGPPAPLPFPQPMSPQPQMMMAHHPPVMMMSPAPVMPSTFIIPQLDEDSVHLTCPRCSNNVQTKIDYKMGVCSFISCFLLLGTCCCCIPLCCDDCKDVTHTCPACGYRIGTYKRV